MPGDLDEVDVHIASGINAAKEGDCDVAINNLQTAMDELNVVADGKPKRDCYVRVANLLIRLNAVERGLEAARAAVAVDEVLADRNLLGQDIMLCGTAIGTLGNLPAAEKAYRDARQIFIEDENWANAASATTNIAILVGQDDIDQGIVLLEESLVYLDRQSFPKTEITTRVALIQALVKANRPPECTFDVAAKLFEKFWDDLRTDQRENSVGPLDEVIDRYLIAHPVADPATWKAERFPAAYG